MDRLLVLVEGETEETFVKELLAPQLYANGFIDVRAKLMGNVRQRVHRGGIRNWEAVRREITGHLRRDAGLTVTTLVDYYGLPNRENDPRSWPGRHQAAQLTFDQKGPCVETAMTADIEAAIGSSLRPGRLVPFVVMHEFEGLLFSDCHGFAQGIGRPDLEPHFQSIRDSFRSPEDINDAEATHPSKRVQNLMREYRKPFHGNIAALEIGLESIRSQCAHFRDWLQRLEKTRAI